VDLLPGRSGEAPTLVDATSTGSGTRRSLDEHRLPRGTTLGRYVVLERIGAGGMGVVYAAYDPQLDRRIALKLLHDDEEREGGTGGRSRMLREAQAMARLSHPNVVAVHDVGVVENPLWDTTPSSACVFVAMEFVDGITLGRWIDQGAHRWREVVPIFEAAGRGLAAAHAAGLVHRDFKPDNVMIGTDGRVRVMDFGLARAAVEITASSFDVAASSMALSDVDRLTRTGAMVGTPAYMAPELLSGGQADPRSDQFAFCVAFFRALHGVAPFAGDTLAALFGEVSAGRIASTPAGVRVPGWLSAIVRRGLDPDPTRRFASMQALLSAMERGRARRGQWVVASAAIAVVGAIGVGSIVAAQSSCSDGRERLEPAWSTERRDALRAAFVGSAAADGDATAERTIAAIDGWADRWGEAYREACEATQAGVQSDRLLDLRMTCLARRITDLEATATVLAEADRDVVLRAADLVAAIPTVDECSDGERLLAADEGALDPATAAAVEALRPQLARARALQRARRPGEGLEVARALVTEAEALGHRPLLAEALHAQGMLVFDSGDAKGAVEVLQRACFEAEAGRNDEIAARAWSMLIHVQGTALADRAAGDAAATRAEAAALRLGNPPELVGDVLFNRGGMYLQRGEYDRGLADHREALRLLTEAHGEMHVDVGESYSAIGNALYMLGRPAEALQHYQQARAVLEQVVGPRHPSVGNVVLNIGSMLMVMGRPDEARAAMQEALTILEEGLGPEHPAVGQALFNLGWMAESVGDYEDALAAFERARKLELPRLGPEHPLVGEYEASMGIVAHKLGREEVARGHLQTALSIFEKALGPDHNNVARVHNDLALVERAVGDDDAAMREHRAALRIRRKALPKDHPELADTLDNLAVILVEKRQFAEAVVLCEELLAIREVHAQENPQEVVEALLLSAQARDGLGQRAKAKALLERARPLSATLDPKWRARIEAAWQALAAG